MDKNEKNMRQHNGFKRAKEITKKHAHTFYLAAQFLPSAQRHAAYTLYAICRIVDDSVDIQTSIRQLTALKENIESIYNNEPPSDDLLFAFKETINNYQIPKIYFDKLIEGMYMDFGKSRYENFDQLYTYCYRVAGVIGLMMLKIFGVRNVKAEKFAVELGIAMQLTNIIRDIKEDYRRNRIYIPGDEMLRFGVNEEHFKKEIRDDRFRKLLQFQIQRAQNYYGGSSEGIRMIESPRLRIVALAMKDMYADILKLIVHNDYDVFSKRNTVSLPVKLKTLFKIIFRGIR